MSAGLILQHPSGAYEVCRLDPTGDTNVACVVGSDTEVKVLAKDRPYYVPASMIEDHLQGKKPRLCESVDAVLREHIVKVEGNTKG